MRKLFWPICVILIPCLFAFFSCQKDEIISFSDREMIDHSDYFPLHVGDYWGLSDNSRQTIVSEFEMNGMNYFQQVSESDTIFYRKTTDGRVYQKTKVGSKEGLKFDLNADEGETWIYHFTESLTYHVTLESKNDKIILGNHEIENCYKFFFDIKGSIDEEHTIWLAPGIGIVAQSSLWGVPGRLELKMAQINGVDIQF